MKLSSSDDPPVSPAKYELALAEPAQGEHSQPFGSRVSNPYIGDHAIAL